MGFYIKMNCECDKCRVKHLPPVVMPFADLEGAIKFDNFCRQNFFYVDTEIGKDSEWTDEENEILENYFFKNNNLN